MGSFCLDGLVVFESGGEAFCLTLHLEFTLTTLVFGGFDARLTLFGRRTFGRVNQLERCGIVGRRLFTDKDDLGGDIIVAARVFRLLGQVDGGLIGWQIWQGFGLIWLGNQAAKTVGTE